MRKVNISMLMEGIAFTLLGIILFLLSITGAYMYYVTPRTIPYLYFASAVLVAMGAYALYNLFSNGHIRSYSHLMILLIPMLLIGWSVNDTGIVERLAQSAASRKTEFSTSSREHTYTMKASVFKGIVLHGYDDENKCLVIPEEETYYWLVEIFDNPEPFLGFSVTTMGQVLKNPAYFDEGCFSPVRQLMTCCAADLYSIGFTCEYENTDHLQTNAWVSVTGKLELREFEEYSELRIVVEDITPSAPPREPYLYSY